MKVPGNVLDSGIIVRNTGWRVMRVAWNNGYALSYSAGAG